MAQLIFAKVIGGEVKELNGLSTVAEVQEELELGSGFTATVNGETATGETRLRENDYVMFAKATKGGK